MQVYADAVYNHMSGGELETNPDFRREGWTRFRPASGRFAFDYACFHPSRFQRYDGESWGGMADLCHRNPVVYDAIMAHANMLITEIGFDGFRFDFVKGYGAWMIRSIHERQYVRGRRLVFPFGVGESWSGDNEIDAWLDEINRYWDNPISAFDFPLRYRLKDMCDTYGYSLRRLAEGGTVMAERPDRAVTFVDNHDFRGGDSPPDHQRQADGVRLHPHAPRLSVRVLARLLRARAGASRQPARHRGAGVRPRGDAGGEPIVRYVDDDLYVMERTGWQSAPGLVFVLNNRGDGWDGTFVDTSRAGTAFRPVAWSGRDDAAPQPTATAADGRGQFWAPPRGYAVYVPGVANPVRSLLPACGEKVRMRGAMARTMAARWCWSAPRPRRRDRCASSPANPQRPGPEQLLLRVTACGVCRTDLQLCEGDLAAPHKLPIVPGHQIVGRVEAVGAGVPTGALGDRAGVAWLAGADGICDKCRSGPREPVRRARPSPAGTSTAASRRMRVARADFALRIPDASTTWPRRRCCVAASSATGRSSAAGSSRAGGSVSTASALRPCIALQVARHWGCRIFVAHPLGGGTGARARARRRVGRRLRRPRRPSRWMRRSRSRRRATSSRGAPRRSIAAGRWPSTPSTSIGFPDALRRAVVGAPPASVANFTRADARDSSTWPRDIPVRTTFETYPARRRQPRARAAIPRRGPRRRRAGSLGQWSDG